MNEKLKEDQHFQKYYSRLRLEAFLKSLLYSGLITFTASFAAALVSWFVFPVGFWIALALLLPITAVLTALFYFVKFRPTTISNARRLDRLGLNERLVTMIDYQEDDSFMAKIQREDAKSTLEKISAKDIKLALPKKILITVSIALTLALGMTVVSGLCCFGVIPTAAALLEEATEPESNKYVQAKYRVRNIEQGYLLGEAEQYVLKGADAKIVIAIANDGYTFESWSDGKVTPARIDTGLMENLDVYAIFSEIDDSLMDDDGGGDEPDDLPPESGNDSNSSDDSSNDGPAKYETYNQFIDGETYYRELLELYKDEILDYLDAHGAELSPEERAVIEAYIGIV